MRKLVLSIMLLVSTLVFGQELACPGSLYGSYVSEEGEVLTINSMNEFTRIQNGEIVATGTLTCSEQEINVMRSNGDQYGLIYFVGKLTLVITKPNSKQAWIWNRIN